MLTGLSCPWCGSRLVWLGLVGPERPMVTCVGATCPWQGRRRDAYPMELADPADVASVDEWGTAG
jgi:hypothetical protein